MSTLGKAAVLSLAAVLLIPSAASVQPRAEQEPVVLLVQQPEAQDARTITVLRDGEAAQMELDTYLTRVVLSELPASFEPEAMQAQAVAARTFVCRQQLRGKHPDADVCTESACCQACMSEEQLRARLGDGFEAAWDKASAAVQATEGEVLTYDGALIEATYFSCSGGTTEAAAAVWGSDVPYLQSVSSPGEQDAARYQSTATLSPQAFAAAIRTLDEGLRLSDDPADWVQGITRTDGGGVDTACIGGKTFTGTQLRRAFGLNSTKFTLQYRSGAFIFDVLGYGHRVGMSQYGAEAIARLGFDYRAILRYYYRGAELTQMDDLHA